jgi:hypothetical protein
MADTTTPTRVQRTRPRIKGQKGMPPGAKYVGRGTTRRDGKRPGNRLHGRWGASNGRSGTRAHMAPETRSDGRTQPHRHSTRNPNGGTQ